MEDVREFMESWRECRLKGRSMFDERGVCLPSLPPPPPMSGDTAATPMGMNPTGRSLALVLGETASPSPLGGITGDAPAGTNPAGKPDGEIGRSMPMPFGEG
jgi:hypothetical protein